MKGPYRRFTQPDKRMQLTAPIVRNVRLCAV
jgi:hypothetical protein